MCFWLFDLFLNKFSENLQWKRNQTTLFWKKGARATIPETFARTVVSSWKSAHARGAVREPWKRMIVRNLLLEVCFFLAVFLHPFVSHKVKILMKMVTGMDPKGDSFGSCFQKKWENRKVRFDCTGAYGLHVSPCPGTPKATQNYAKKWMDSMNSFFLRKNQKNYKKWFQKCIQKGDGISC